MPAPKLKSDEAYEIWDRIQDSADFAQIKFDLVRLKREVSKLEAIDLASYFLFSGIIASYDGDLAEMQRKFVLLKQQDGVMSALEQAVPVCLNLGLFSTAAELIQDLDDPTGFDFSNSLAFATTKLFSGDFSACTRAIANMERTYKHQDVRPWEMFVLSNIVAASKLLESEGILSENFANTIKTFESLVKKKLPLNSLEYVANFDVIDNGIVIHYDVPEERFDEDRVMDERDLLLDVLMELDDSVPATLLTADIWTKLPTEKDAA